MIKRKSQLTISLILLISFLLTACLGGGEFAAIDSNLQDYDLNNMPYTLEEITIEFNNAVTEADIAFEENEQASDRVAVDVDGEQVTISNLELKPFSLYNLNLNAKDEEGNQVSKQRSFLTELETVEIEDPNPTMMQAFYWEIGEKGDAEAMHLWELLQDRAEKISEAGITSLWLPPAHKAWRGMSDIGYGTYDIWDLGEFEQPSDEQYQTVRTRYGTKDQLEDALEAIKAEGMEAYYDIVFNHRMGAKRTETVPLSEESPDLAGEEVEAWTYFDFAGRQEYYSRADEWQWNWEAFNAADYDAERDLVGDFLFEGKDWNNSYDDDLLMGTNVDYQNEDVVHEMKEWGQWIVDDIDFDGFRLDAVKHIDSDFTDQWVDQVREETDKDPFFVAEAWEGEVNSLIGYLEHVGNDHLNAFDFPLRGAFQDMRDTNLELDNLGNRGLVNDPEYGERAVTFVDNHDTDRDGDEYGRAIENYKLQAYTYILMHENGLPKVYWKDYYIRDLKSELNSLLEARRRFAYGDAYEADSNDEDTFSYIRAGSEEVPGSGLVAMITADISGGLVEKEVDSRQPNTAFLDITGNVNQLVHTDEDGYGNFKVTASEAEGWSVWVPLGE